MDSSLAIDPFNKCDSKSRIIKTFVSNKKVVPRKASILILFAKFLAFISLAEKEANPY